MTQNGSSPARATLKLVLLLIEKVSPTTGVPVPV
jgi:hypothetical protein